MTTESHYNIKEIEGWIASPRNRTLALPKEGFRKEIITDFMENEKEPQVADAPIAPKKVAKQKTSRKKARKSPRPFPSVSLEEALKIPQLIKEKNGGNPWPPAEVAKALGSTAKSNKMWYVSSSARDYGLTVGTRDTPQIEITPLGREVVYAPSKEAEAQSVKKAFFNVEVFKKVFDYYNDGNLPELEYLNNTLTSTFGVSPEHHTDFHKIFTENLSFLARFPNNAAANTSSTAYTPEKPHSIIVGQPAKGKGVKAFVAMPFNEKTGKYPAGFYAEVLKSLITPAGVKAGFEVVTAKRDGSDVIQATIVNNLLDADLVIVDLSDHNPNVLFELGLRMANDKPIALIRAIGTPPIFDVDHLLRVFEYDPNLWKSTIEQDIPRLTEHIRATWENRETRKTYMKILREETKA